MNEKLISLPKFKDRLVLLGKDNIIGLSKGTDDKHEVNTISIDLNKTNLINKTPITSKEIKFIDKNILYKRNLVSAKEKALNNIPTPNFISNQITLENSTFNENSDISSNKNKSPNKFKLDEISRNNHNLIHEISNNHSPNYTHMNNNYSNQYISLDHQSLVYLNPNLYMIPHQIYRYQINDECQTNNFNNNQSFANLYPSEITYEKTEKGKLKKVNIGKRRYILPKLENNSFSAEKKNKKEISPQIQMNNNNIPFKGIRLSNEDPKMKNCVDYNINNKKDNSKGYSPYTLKDYKELINEKIVFGGLGANIRTEDWNSRMKKMKKILNYSDCIKQTNKSILKPLKKTPDEEIYIKRLENIEKSNKTRSKMYGISVQHKYRNKINLSSSKVNDERFDEIRVKSNKYKINISLNRDNYINVKINDDQIFTEEVDQINL